MRELNPDFARQRRFRTSSDAEDAHCRGIKPETLDVHPSTSSWWMETVSQGRETPESFSCHASTSSNIVWTEFVDDAADGDGVRQQFRSLP